MNFEHISVLLSESIDALQLKPGMTVVDCTVGLGGHSAHIAQAVSPNGKVIGFDQDKSAMEIAQKRLAAFIESGVFQPISAPFSEFRRITEEMNVFGNIDGVLADIGVSSMQIDNPERGFSFNSDGPLDMRMNQNAAMTAETLVNTWAEQDLARLFWQYGEEPKSRSIAAKIVRARQDKPFTRTLQLAEFIKKELHYGKPSKKHPATKIFQAIRIEVNQELEELKTLMRDGFAGLKSGGRLAVITFHSLEDRIVKQEMQALTSQHRQQAIPKGLPITDAAMNQLVQATGKIIKPFPTLPGEKEVFANPRARSAKLRVIEKL